METEVRKRFDDQLDTKSPNTFDQKRGNVSPESNQDEDVICRFIGILATTLHNVRKATYEGELPHTITERAQSFILKASRQSIPSTSKNRPYFQTRALESYTSIRL